MRKMIGRLMAMRLVAVSLAASAQSGDNMKPDSMQHDDMKQAQISPAPGPIDGEATEPTRGQAHLTVSELDRAIAFYKDVLGLPVARLFPERKVAFFWIGVPGRDDARSLGAGNHADEYQPPCGFPSGTL
jgi:hypothetical protein